MTLRNYLYLFLFSAILLSSYTLNAANINGFVYGEGNKPLDAVLVRSGKHKSLSGRDGGFSIGLSDSLHFSRLGYKNLSLSTADVYALQKQSRSFVVRMLSEPVQLPTYRVFSHFSEAAFSPADLLTIPIDPDRHYNSAVEMLEQSASLQTSGTTLKGEVTNLSILGNISRHTLVLVNGIAVNPGGEPYDFSQLDPASIESIEVIKNNASVYGGAAAIGGLVMISTKQGSKRQSELESDTELGSYGYVRQQLSASGMGVNSSYRVSFSGFRALNNFPIKDMELIPADADEIRLNNNKRQGNLSAAYAILLKPVTVSLAADYTAFHRELPGPLNFVDLYRQAWLEGYSLRPQLRMSANYRRINWQSNSWLLLDATTYDNTRSELSAARMKYEQKLWSYGTRNSFKLAYNNWLTGLSAESSAYRYVYRNLLNQTVAGIAKTMPQSSISANLQYQAQPGWFLLSNAVALRYDHITDTDQLSGRYEFKLRNTGNKYLELGGTIGNSFAVPSPFDLYWKGDSQAMGNPDLLGEKSVGYQIWLQGAVPGFSLKAAVHRNKLKNLIVWRQVQMNGTGWKPVNVGKAEIRNLELELESQPFNALQINASALFTQARDTGTYSFQQAPQLMYRPEALYALFCIYAYHAVQLWGKLSYTGKQWTTPDNLIDPIAAYTLLDCGFSYKYVTHKWEISPYASIQNLFDQAYMVHAYVPEPGRSYYFGLRLGKS